MAQAPAANSSSASATSSPESVDLKAIDDAIQNICNLRAKNSDSWSSSLQAVSEKLLDSVAKKQIETILSSKFAKTKTADELVTIIGNQVNTISTKMYKKMANGETSEKDKKSAESEVTDDEKSYDPSKGINKNSTEKEKASFVQKILDAAAESAAKDIKACKEQEQEAQKRADEADAELKKCEIEKEKIVKDEKDIADQKVELDKLDAEVQKLQADHRKSVIKLEQEVDELNKLKQEADALQKEEDLLTKMENMTEDEKKALLEKMDISKAKLDDLLLKIDQQQQVITKLETLLKDLDNQIEQLQKQIEALEVELRKLKNRLAALTKQHKLLEADAHKLQEEADKLNKDAQDLQQSAQQIESIAEAVYSAAKMAAACCSWFGAGAAILAIASIAYYAAKNKATNMKNQAAGKQAEAQGKTAHSQRLLQEAASVKGNMEECEKSILQTETTLKEKKDDLKGLEKKRADTRKDLTAALDAKNTLSTAAAEQEAGLKALTMDKNQITQRLSDLKGEKAEKKIKVDSKNEAVNSKKNQNKLDAQTIEKKKQAADNTCKSYENGTAKLNARKVRVEAAAEAAKVKKAAWETAKQDIAKNNAKLQKDIASSMENVTSFAKKMKMPSSKYDMLASEVGMERKNNTNTNNTSNKTSNANTSTSKNTNKNENENLNDDEDHA